MRPLVSPGGNDELARAEAARAPVREDFDLRRQGRRARRSARLVPARTGAPHRGRAYDLHPGGPDPVDEAGPGSELPIAPPAPDKSVARGELLEVLPARLRPLVEDGREHAGPGGGLGRGEAGRTGPDDDEVPVRFRPRVRRGRPRRRNEGDRLRSGAGRFVVSVGGDRHAVAHAGHARPLRRKAVHRHEALEADPHAAEDAARIAAARTAKRGDAGRGEGGGHRLPLDRRHRPPLEVDGNCAAVPDDSGCLEAKGGRDRFHHGGLSSIVGANGGSAGSSRPPDALPDPSPTRNRRALPAPFKAPATPSRPPSDCPHVTAIPQRPRTRN